MFTKTNKPETPGMTPAQDAVRGASSKPSSRVGASIICSDMKIVGSITTEGALQIDGIVEGDVSAGDITIGSTGSITGEIKSQTLRVKGQVHGSIRSKKVELETGAAVDGDIYHAALIIQPDATFEGQVKRQDDPLKETAPKAAAPAAEPKPATTTTPPSTTGFGSIGNA